MFYIRREGDIMHNGFNFYPLSDKNSIGFIFRYGKYIPLTKLGSTVYTVRYSKLSKQWHFEKQTFEQWTT